MIHRRAVRLATIVAIAVAGAAGWACSDPPDEPDDPYVVTSVPWTAPELLSYVLMDQDEEEEIGRGTLAVLEVDEGFTLVQRFSNADGDATDESVLITEPLLEPLRGSRELLDIEEGERRTVDTEYGELDNGEYGVRIRQQVFDPADSDEADSTRCNPLGLPESAYDNDSSLFLWRTLPFEEDLEVRYTAAIPNRRDSRIVTLLVGEVESIETPAGTFDAWHVFVIAEGQSHDAWFDVEAPHRMVRYDNDQQVFLYEGESDDISVPAEPAGVPQDCG